VGNWPVRDGKFSQVVTDHFWLDLDLDEGLAVVDTTDVANHFRDDDHVSAVGFHDSWFFELFAVFLSPPEFGEKVSVLLRGTSGEGPPFPGVHHVGDFFSGHIEKFVEFDTPVGVLLEGPSFLLNVSHFRLISWDF